jgi:hypothetical protein
MAVSTATLTTMRARIGQALMDTGAAIWAQADQDEALRRALHEYSSVYPYRTVVSQALTSVLSTNGREINVSAVSGLIDVFDVWAPYVAATDKPTVRKFEYWLDQMLIYIPDGDKLLSTDTARIFYTKQHTLSGLDSAGATTIRAGDDSLILLGAVGYAAQSRAIDLTEQVTLDRQTVDFLQKLSADSLAAFRAGLDRIVKERAASTNRAVLR